MADLEPGDHQHREGVEVQVLPTPRHQVVSRAQKVVEVGHQGEHLEMNLYYDVGLFIPMLPSTCQQTGPWEGRQTAERESRAWVRVSVEDTASSLTQFLQWRSLSCLIFNYVWNTYNVTKNI